MYILRYSSSILPQCFGQHRFYGFDKFLRLQYFNPWALTEKPHDNAVAVYFGFDNMRFSCSFYNPRRRQFIKNSLYGYARIGKTDNSQCPRPHKQAALPEQPFVKRRCIGYRKVLAMNDKILYAVYAKI